MATSNEVQRLWHTLPDGVRLEVLHLAANVQQTPRNLAKTSDPAALSVSPALPATGAVGGQFQPASPVADAATSSAHIPGEGDLTSTADSNRLAPAVAAKPGSEADCPPAKAPLVFVHGAFHGAWCWAEHFMPYFSAAGYDCFALSLRGHGESELGAQHPTGATGTLQTHADDVASFVATLPRPPVLVVHSFSGLVAVKYVSQLGGAERPPLAGLAMLGSTGGVGTSGVVRRTFWRSPLRLAKIAWCFIFKSYRASPALCRFLFFSEELPQEALEQYRARLAASGTLPLMNAGARGPENAVPHVAPSGGWLHLPPSRVFVGCGALDVLIDAQAVEEAAGYFGGAHSVVWEGVAHDCMLDAGWRATAASLCQWLDMLPGVQQ